MADPRRALAEYVEKTWAQVEKGVEESVARAFSKVKVPRREQLQEFRARLDQMERRLDVLEARRG